MDSMEQRWEAFFGDNLLAAEVLLDLRRRYAEKHRAYHTLDHITKCLGHFDTIREALEWPRAVEVSLWFHDAIYNPRSATNEVDSADLAARQLLSLGEDLPLIDSVRRMINITKHPSEPGSQDESYLLDIDLAILGAPQADFDIYEANIRREYKWVPRFIYRRERSKVLRMFLQQECIYHTEHFHGLLERQARENIERALTTLG